jgi:hypothetical protein
MAALQAKPQMNPVVAHLQAFFAAVGRARSDVFDLIQM